MKYKKGIPKQSGYYWYDDQYGAEQVVLVDVDYNELFFIGDNGRAKLENFKDMSFAGPIEEPGEE